MILGVGTDIVELARVSAALARSPALVERVLTQREQTRYHSLAPARAAAYFAKRFAAKEATVKALGCGIGENAGWQDIEVTNNAKGKPQLILSGAALAFFEASKGRSLHLSLTDEKAYAVAFVIAED